MKKKKYNEKRKFYVLTVCLLIAVSTTATAQHAPSPRAPIEPTSASLNRSSLSKQAFLKKVSDFNKMSNQSTVAQIFDSWKDIRIDILRCFADAEQKYESMNSEDDKHRFSRQQQEQSRLFDKLTVLAADIQKNKADIYELMLEFGNNITD